MTADASTHAIGTHAEARALSNAATTAAHAPSIHNTQPWRWRLTYNELDLYLDHSRSLEVTDPDSRLAILSCGAALHHALISLAADGWHAILAQLPNPEHPDHLAQVRLDHRIPVDPAAMRDLQTIGLRHTDSRPTLGTPIGTERLRTIAAAAESAGAGLHLLRPDQVNDLATAFAILYGPQDSRLDWLRAGQALSAAWLTATDLGVSVLPLSATIELDATRQHLRHLIADRGYPYLVLRFGTPDPPDTAAPHTPRLPRDQIIARVS